MVTEQDFAYYTQFPSLELEMNEAAAWLQTWNIPAYAKNVYHPTINKMMVRLCFKSEQGPSSERVALISVPKSGTFMFVELLKNMGLVYTEILLNVNTIEDYRFDKTMIVHPKSADFKTVTNMILSGQFVAGHIMGIRESEKYLQSFRKVLTYRNMRDCVVSMTRFTEKVEQKHEDPALMVGAQKSGPLKTLKFLELHGNKYYQECMDVLPWFSKKECLQVKFETIMGDEGEHNQMTMIERLHTFLGLKQHKSAKELIAKTTSTQTQTSSGERSQVEKYWNDEVERWFVKLGFDRINQKLGYM